MWRREPERLFIFVGFDGFSQDSFPELVFRHVRELVEAEEPGARFLVVFLHQSVVGFEDLVPKGFFIILCVELIETGFILGKEVSEVIFIDGVGIVGSLELDDIGYDDEDDLAEVYLVFHLE